MNIKYSYVFVAMLVVATAFGSAAARRAPIDQECASIGFKRVLESWPGNISSGSVSGGEVHSWPGEKAYISLWRDDFYQVGQNVGVGVIIKRVDGGREVHVFESQDVFRTISRSGRYQPDSIDALKVCY